MNNDNQSDQPETDITDGKSSKENFGPKITRRSFLQGSAAVSAGIAAPIYLAGVSKSFAAKGGAVKIGHIEDLSGNLAVYGVQKDHGAQLAVKEINAGKTLKGGPVGSGGLGSLSNYAANPPIMGNGDKDLKFVNDGGKLTESGMAFVEDELALEVGEAAFLALRVGQHERRRRLTQLGLGLSLTGQRRRRGRKDHHRGPEADPCHQCSLHVLAPVR